MKHPGSSFEYEDERNEDLMRAYREEVALAGNIKVANLFRAIVDRPSTRFWVSEERAFVVISRMLKGDVLAGMRRLKREMYEEIYRRYIELRKKHPGKSVRHIVSMVVCQPAPKFYIEPASARVIVCKIKKRWRQERRWHLRRR